MLINSVLLYWIHIMKQNRRFHTLTLILSALGLKRQLKKFKLLKLVNIYLEVTILEVAF
jgi:hypothetical protein